MAKWTCDRCGGEANTRKERRLHAKCSMGQMERVQRAMAFNDPAWVEEVRQAALAGSEKARKLWIQKDEALRDLALLKKQINMEQERMALQGLKLDGTPLDPESETVEVTETTTTENTNEN